MDWEGAVGFSGRSKQLHVWSGNAWASHDHPQQPSQNSAGQGSSGALVRQPPVPAAAALPRPEAPALERPQRPAAAAKTGPSQPMRTLRPLSPEVALKAAQFAGDSSLPHSSVQALLECHYSVHGAFQLLQNPILSPATIAELRTIPCIAVQGQEDMVCPPGTAWALHEVWPEMELRLVPGAGHSMYDPAITHELIEAHEAMRRLFD